MIPGLGRYPRGGHDNPLPGESHGQRRLAGYNPWGHKSLDMTKVIQHVRMYLVVPNLRGQGWSTLSAGWHRQCLPGEGNGNPLQYSCLESPIDGGTWRATVHGVAKSQTRLSDFTFTSFGSGEVPALLDLSNCWLVHFFSFFKENLVSFIYFKQCLFMCVFGYTGSQLEHVV